MKHSYFYIFFLLFVSCAGFHKSQPSSKIRVDFDTVDIYPRMANANEISEYRASATRKFDIIHSDIEITPNWTKRRIDGKITITGRPYFYALDSVELDAKAMIIKNVVLMYKGKSWASKDFSYDSHVLKIKLNQTYQQNDTIQLVIDYTARPYELEDSHLSDTKDHGCYFIIPDSFSPSKPHQIWTQGETQDNSFWFPTIDKPNERMTHSLAITVDNKFVTLSNGDKTKSVSNSNGTRTDVWVMNQPHAPYLVMFAVGEYAVVKDVWRGKEVSYYVEKPYEKYARNIFGETPKMLEFFSNLLNYPYPWSKYSQVVVRDYISGAMENTGAVVFGEFAQKTDRELLSDNDELTIAHELFHHWFGDLVTCESWSNLPLNESFANYSEYLWLEHKYGRPKADAHHLDEMNQYFHEFPFKNEHLIRFHYLNREDMFDSHSYAKGGRVLHMLRKLVGDKAFFASLNVYLTRNQYQTVEIHQLRLAFEEVTGMDLNWFFNQWFLNKGFPQLNVTTTYLPETKMVQIEVNQLQELTQAPVYKLPVEVDVYAGGKTSRLQLWITDINQKFLIPCSSVPDLVNFDADKSTLCTKIENKTSREWEFQFYNAPLYGDKHEALMYFADNLKSKNRDKIMLEAMSSPWDDMRILALTLLSNEGEFQWLKGHSAAIRQIATGDPSAEARSLALDLFADLSNNKKEVEELALRLIQDSAAVVFSAALQILNELNPAKAFELLPGLMQYNTASILSTAAEIYANHPKLEFASFFYQNFDKTEWGQPRFDFIMNFSKYLTSLEDKNEIIRSNIYFERLIQSDDMWFVRLAGYFGLAYNREFWNKQHQEFEGKLKNASAENREKLQKQIQEARERSLEIDSKLELLKKKETSTDILEFLKSK